MQLYRFYNLNENLFFNLKNWLNWLAFHELQNVWSNILFHTRFPDPQIPPESLKDVESVQQKDRTWKPFFYGFSLCLAMIGHKYGRPKPVLPEAQGASTDLF